MFQVIHFLQFDIKAREVLSLIAPIGEYLASKGHKVYATVRKDSDFEELEKIQNVTPFKVDVADKEGIKSLKKFVESQGKGLYGLINNSGVTDLIAITEMDDDDFDYIMQVNLYGHSVLQKPFMIFSLKLRGELLT